MRRSRLITQVAIVPGGGHDHVTVHIAGKCVGTLVVGAGEGKALADLLLRAEDETESWLVKDFNVLYRAASAVVNAEPDARGNVDDSHAEHLERQLARLRPAYEMTEGVRVGGRPSTLREDQAMADYEATKKAGEGD